MLYKQQWNPLKRKYTGSHHRIAAYKKGQSSYCIYGVVTEIETLLGTVGNGSLCEHRGNSANYFCACSTVFI
jgi:hypothetical protein